MLQTCESKTAGKTKPCKILRILLLHVIFMSNVGASASFANEKNFQTPVSAKTQPSSESSLSTFDRIMAKAKKDNWRELPIRDLMGRIAIELEGTPYVGGVLDRNTKQEVCTVNLGELDCVTFFESTLDLARTIKKGESSLPALEKEITFTRYRNGKLTDYTSRLHYTTDWFHDNQHKHVVNLLQKLPGSQSFTQKVDFMSTHPQSYPALIEHPEFVAVLKKQELAVNSRHLNFIPLDKIAAIEPLLKTGDIVGICTNLPGLDIVHTGLIYRDESGIPHFMDASSKKSNMKVTIEPGPISGALGWSKNNIGIMLARPLEP